MEEKRFAFGKNWKNYVASNFSDATVARAEQSMKDFLRDETLKDKSFLDVGCGSGMHSLVAKKLGAAPIVSIDYDKDSVECTEQLAKAENAENWTVKQGSVLDQQFMESLGTFDVVYCWGVAHHTGDMWTALENLAHNVKDGGLLYVAIYNTLEGYKGSRTWYRVKKIYVSSPRIIQAIMEDIYIASHVVKILSRFRNPVKVFREYGKKRGMSYRHDLIDWLGGYPYEHARAEEIFRFYHDKHGMELLNLKTSNFLGNNLFLFKKRN